MLRRSLLALAAAALAAPAAAFQVSAPTESVWKPADTPKGGVAWSLLESTKELTRTNSRGHTVSKPEFPAGVRALNGKKIKVAGYMMPLQNGKNQTHFVLLAYPPDCPFHLNPGPAQFIEVKTVKGVPFDYSVKTIEGVLELAGQDEGGVFYRMSAGRAL